MELLKRKIDDYLITWKKNAERGADTQGDGSVVCFVANDICVGAFTNVPCFGRPMVAPT